jgi:hypothetical protein
VATFEGNQAQIAQMAEAVGHEPGPPEGVPAKEVLVLTGRENAKLVAIVVFETEEDLRQGDATFNQMSPRGCRDRGQEQRRNVRGRCPRERLTGPPR